MAELILTDKEKETSFAQLSDEELGKHMKYSAFMFDDKDKEDHEKDSWYIKLGILFWVNKLVDMNVTEASAKFTGLSSGDVYNGDWEVELRRTDDGTQKPVVKKPKEEVEKSYDFHIRADNITKGERLSTFWNLFKSALSALFLGKMSIVATKNMKFTQFTERTG